MGQLIRCIFGEMFTRKILFDGQNSDQQQIRKIYDKMGEPMLEWPEALSFPFWNELQPQIRYLNSLETYLKANSLEVISEAGIDFISKLLTWNPKKRLSAAEALNHAFFKEEPIACKTADFPEFKKDYHYLSMKNAEKKKKDGVLF